MQTVPRFLWHSIRAYKWFYLVMLIAPICGAFYKPLVYYSIKLMVDIITTSSSFNLKQLLKPILIYVAADIILTVLWRTSTVACWKSEPYVKRGILLHIMSTVLAYRYTFFLNTSGGSIIIPIPLNKLPYYML